MHPILVKDENFQYVEQVKPQQTTEPVASRETDTDLEGTPGRKAKKKRKLKLSKVDTKIPVTDLESPNTFALIIGNEDYSTYQETLEREMNVPYAVQDAKIFKEYLVQTVGLDEENILYLENATAIKMKRAVKKLQLLAKSTDGEASIVVYYAGHGLPHQQTKEPYLMPVDVSASDIEFGLKLSDLYKKLTKYPTKKTLVVLDACFTGGGRKSGLLSARAARVKPKKGALSGNLVVFSASSGSQTSMPYKKKRHGLFSYYLLKKLQSSQGEVTLGEMARYLKKQVSIKSILVNSKEQTPTVRVSSDMKGAWKNMSFGE